MLKAEYGGKGEYERGQEGEYELVADMRDGSPMTDSSVPLDNLCIVGSIPHLVQYCKSHVSEELEKQINMLYQGSCCALLCLIEFTSSSSWRFQQPTGRKVVERTSCEKVYGCCCLLASQRQRVAVEAPLQHLVAEGEVVEAAAPFPQRLEAEEVEGALGALG